MRACESGWVVAVEEGLRQAVALHLDVPVHPIERRDLFPKTAVQDAVLDGDDETVLFLETCEERLVQSREVERVHDSGVDAVAREFLCRRRSERGKVPHADEGNVRTLRDDDGAMERAVVRADGIGALRIAAERRADHDGMLRLRDGPAQDSEVLFDARRCEKDEVRNMGENRDVIEPEMRHIGRAIERRPRHEKDRRAAVDADVLRHLIVRALIERAVCAKDGARPVFGTYSTFYQRTYDQMAQDVCINRSPAVFLVTGASLYRSTDVTHLGFYDISIFSHVPNLVFLAPTSIEEHLAVLRWAIAQTEHPVMIRTPLGGYAESPYPVRADYSALHRSIVVTEGADVALIGVGNFAALATAAAEELARDGIHATVVNPLYLSGLDEALLTRLKEKHRLIVTVEDGILDGGFGEKVAAFYGVDRDVEVKSYGLPKAFFNRYDPAALARAHHLTAPQIAADVRVRLRS